MLQDRNGYTLIELLASITILTLVIVAVIPLFTNIAQWTNKSETNLIGSNLIGEVVYDLKMNPGEFNSKNITSCSGDYSLFDKYTTYEVDEKEYYVDIQLCQEEMVDLYRTKIQIYSHGNLISETYTYIPVGG
jgi:prepilin-type N-terminal cleavage/methylation domain-containing protein